ncbi:heterokaryon incompatibility protein-domain-containing protein [Xylaria digitata]|nr:heterokaryon incompatibility protein-domain-containing protein [Xylaria digitata]
MESITATKREYNARPRYAYQPLIGHQIRMAEIHPGELSDIVTISLYYEPFEVGQDGESPNIPHYEALSYVWGSRDNPDRLFIEHSEIEITRNLSIALKHLRHPSASRYMWIDALCIDQGNDAEKGPCVAMMGDIYQHAMSVLVWLGEEENNSDRAMSLLKRLGEQIEVDFETMGLSLSAGGTDASLANKTVPIPFDADEYTSIYFLFCRAWFNRLWIRQEIFLAKPAAAIVACGRWAMPWTTLQRAMGCIVVKDNPPFEYVREWGARIPDIFNFVFIKPGAVFPQLRDVYASARCADHRDRIYGILSLDGNARELGIVPDYVGMKTHMELYEDVTRRALERWDHLDILDECVLEDGSCPDGPGPPTWVPDWSTGSPYRIPLGLPNRYASGCLRGPKPLIVEKRLRVLAVPIDEISEIRQHSVGLLNPEGKTLNSVRDLLPTSRLTHEYPSGGNLLEAYASVFMMGLFSDSSIQHYWNNLRGRDSLQFIQRFLSSSEDMYLNRVSLEEKHALVCIGTSLAGRSVSTTKTGYIGLAPVSAASGDEICVIVGCFVPMVLRPVGEGQRVVVGSCYVEGFMDGEAVLGPLPNGVKRTLNPSSDHTFTGTGAVDPRLVEWTELDKSLIPGYLEENCRYFFEVDVDDLRRHGVHNAQYYDLV